MISRPKPPNPNAAPSVAVAITWTAAARIPVARTGKDVARANYEASLAAIRQVQGALNQYRDQLSKTTIYAPMDGTISVLNNE